MSEKKPFDAAIKILRDSTIRLRAFNIKPNDMDFAIRVLEAAGKVDKRGAGAAFALLTYGARERLRKTPMLKGLLEQIRALLEALPEKEGK